MRPSRRRLAGAFVCVLAAVAAAPAARAVAAVEVVVRYRDGSSAGARAAALSAAGAARVRAVLPGADLVRAAGPDAQAAASAIARDPAVAWAEPNVRFTRRALPRDERFPEQWALRNTGRRLNGVAGTAGADIRAPAAWAVAPRRAPAVIAVADGGVAMAHPDLRGSGWRNPGESGSGRERNGVDDDGNGYVDDWHGWDWVDGDDDPTARDDHGTHVASIAAARAQGSGMVGVAPHAQIVSLRVCEADCTAAAIASAFAYAGAAGIRVVNASFGGPESSRAVEEAIAGAPRTLFVVAAGNESSDLDAQPDYPCSYDLANVVCVGATDQNDAPASFSNSGAATVDLHAPGVNVLGALPRAGATVAVFEDGFESALDGRWIAEGGPEAWTRTPEAAFHGSFSLTDSAGGPYADDTERTIRTAHSLDLSGFHACALSYAFTLRSESGYDAFRVQASRDASSWRTLAEWSGDFGTDWLEDEVDLGAFDGARRVWIRLAFSSDESVALDGVHVDDLALRCAREGVSASGFGLLDGTSMAAPLVAGAAAMLLEAAPWASAASVKGAILAGAARLESLEGASITGARLDLRGALARLFAPTVTVLRASSEDPARLAGRVTAGGRGVEGARVRIQRRTAGRPFQDVTVVTSDAWGRFRAVVRSPGGYRARFGGSGSLLTSVSPTIRAGAR